MIWKKIPSWLKGGIIVGGIDLILITFLWLFFLLVFLSDGHFGKGALILFFLLLALIQFPLTLIQFLFVSFVLILGLDPLIAKIFQEWNLTNHFFGLFLISIGGLIVWVIIGAFIGRTIGRYKTTAKNEKK